MGKVKHPKEKDAPQPVGVLYEVDYHYWERPPTISERTLWKETEKTITVSGGWRGSSGTRQNKREYPWGSGNYKLPRGYYRTRQEAVDAIVLNARKQVVGAEQTLRRLKDELGGIAKEYADSPAWDMELKEED